MKPDWNLIEKRRLDATRDKIGADGEDQLVATRSRIKDKRRITAPVNVGPDIRDDCAIHGKADPDIRRRNAGGSIEDMGCDFFHPGWISRSRADGQGMTK